MRRIILLLLLPLAITVNSHSMTYEQMIKLKGIDMIGKSAEDVLSRYGLPGAIVDHGVTTDQPQKKIKWGRHELSLTEDDWNLVYSSSKIEKIDSRYWINPKRIFPGDFYGFYKVVFFAFNKPNIYNHDQKLKKEY